MVDIRSSGTAPTIEEIQRRFSLSNDEIDTSFGVVRTEDDKPVYTILVEESVASRIEPTADWDTQGPFSNARIEPCGPPQKPSDS